jgi:hypothetical protein
MWMKICFFLPTAFLKTKSSVTYKTYGHSLLCEVYLIYTTFLECVLHSSSGDCHDVSVLLVLLK